MFGTSGVRGPVGETVTADLALRIGRAVGHEADQVVVGRDTRRSGRFLVDALTAGLRELGTDVLDLGVAATPTVARAVAWEDCQAGVVVTASHNPPPDNGIKLWEPSGKAFGPDRRATIEDLVTDDSIPLRPWDQLGERTRITAIDRHVTAIVDAIDLPGTPRVVVDLGNGAGGVTVDALGALGCRVETLNAQPDGSFPGRPSEPTAENCTTLASVVGETDARVGLAHDGDADRTRVVTGDGSFLSGDVTLALLAGATATAGDRVAVPIDTSLAVAEYLNERGVEVIYTPVGDVHVAEAATAPDVPFGGEPSGAWIWPAETLCPDGPLAACRLVALDAVSPLEERVAEIPRYPISRSAVEVADNQAIVDRVAARVDASYDDVTALDGVRVDFADGWFLIRASGTEPLVRLTAEAHTPDRADAILQEARELLDGAR